MANDRFDFVSGRFFFLPNPCQPCGNRVNWSLSQLSLGTSTLS